MRNLIILFGLVVAMFMAGWFTIEPDGEQTTIRINRSEISNDAKHALDRGRNFLDSKLKDDGGTGYAQQDQATGSVSPYGNQLQLQYPQSGDSSSQNARTYDRFSR